MGYRQQGNEMPRAAAIKGVSSRKSCTLCKNIIQRITRCSGGTNFSLNCWPTQISLNTLLKAISQ